MKEKKDGSFEVRGKGGRVVIPKEVAYFVGAVFTLGILGMALGWW